MNKLIAVVAALVAVNLVAGVGDDALRSGVKPVKLSPERAAQIRKNLASFVVKPGSQKGKIAFIDTQSEIDPDVFAALARAQTRKTGFNVVYEKAAAGTPEALKAASKADIAVVVVADDTTPTLLAAVEDGWAVVNVRRLSEGLKTKEAKDKFLFPRCQKEVLRAYAVVAGGIASQYPDNLMDILKVSDLDLCNTFIPNDAEKAMRKYLEARGVTPFLKASYSQACQMGWAPSPTNDEQKAIWDRVHALPTKPIQIKYDPKVDK